MEFSQYRINTNVISRSLALAFPNSDSHQDTLCCVKHGRNLDTMLHIWVTVQNIECSYHLFILSSSHLPLLVVKGCSHYGIVIVYVILLKWVHLQTY